MIRDMELLLNKVYDNEIKSYLYEALSCYSVGAYRACVIISVIGGVHDLHNKLKNLASSYKDFSELEDKVSKAKDDLKPYEKLLIDGCGSPKIDLLNPSESKELNRCLDIRNSCAHPSDYICTAEVARYVFSTIIDILASRPALLGCQCINSIYDKINADTYFPSIDKNEIKIQVENQLKSCNSRIMIPLANKIVNGIKNEISVKNNNKLYFLSNLSRVLSDSFDEIIEPLFLDSNFHSKLMVIISTNPNIIEILSNDNIKRLLHIFKSFTEYDDEYKNVIIETLLSERLSAQEYDNSIVKLLNYNYNKMTYIQTYIWIHIMMNNTYSKQRICLIKSDYIEHITSEKFNKLSFQSQMFQEVFILCDDEKLYRTLALNISHRIADSDFTISNPATQELNGLKENFINKLSPDSISNIIYSILEGSQGYGWDVQGLFDNIESKHFYKRYVEETIPRFNEEEILHMMMHRLTDYTLCRFINKVMKNSADFDTKFISIAKNYIAKNDDEWKNDIIKNCIDKLNKSRSNS